MELIRVAVAIAFAVIALLAARLWRQNPSPATRWLALSFAALAAGLLANRLLPVMPDDAAAVIGRVARAAIVAFPYFLFRFGASLRPPRQLLVHLATLVAGALIIASIVLPVPSPPAPPWYAVFVFAVLGAWTVLSSWVVWLLWRAGRNQPTIAKRRMRTLALAAAVLNAALVAAGFASGLGGNVDVTAITQVVALVSAGLFYLGFAPPRLVRAALRGADERDLLGAERALMAARSRDEVIASMLPGITRLLGGSVAAYVEDEGHEHWHGTPSPHLRESMQTWTGSEPAVGDTVTIALSGGRLGVLASRFTPVFGADEVQMTERLGALMELALNRADLYDRERHAKQRAEALTSELEALVYGLSHDLRNPLVSVLGYVDCLQEDYAPTLDEEGVEFLERLRTNAEYMDRLIADLLELSRVGRVQATPEDVPLHPLVEALAAELRREYGEASIDVDRLPEVRMDPAWARQLFANLVTNALVHSGREDVEVAIRPVVTEDPERVCIAVADNGRGIPSAYRDRVFQLFERLDRAGEKGTGIGLAMCQRIVEHAGGRIWIADRDEGAEVRVLLPAATTATEPAS